jgi:hypothetical protein
MIRGADLKLKCLNVISPASSNRVTNAMTQDQGGWYNEGVVGEIKN